MNLEDQKKLAAMEKSGEEIQPVPPRESEYEDPLSPDPAAPSEFEQQEKRYSEQNPGVPAEIPGSPSLLGGPVDPGATYGTTHSTGQKK